MADILEKKLDDMGRVISQIIPLAGVRKIIGERMRESLDRSPQGTAFLEADMSGFIRFREENKAKGSTLSYAAMFIKAAAYALKEVPAFNSSRQDNEIIVYDNVNISVAMSVEKTLYVPVIWDVQDKDVVEITNEIKTIKEALENRKFSRLKMYGSTFTVNNLGGFMIDGMTAFISPPEAGILGIGRTSRKPCVDENDNIVIKPLTTLSLTNDHAVIDGVPVTEFLAAMQRIMLNPEDYLTVNK